MQTTEYTAFSKIAEALFAAFDKPPNDARMDAYWRGLKSMELLAFERVVDRVVGFEGEDELPTPKQLYAIQRRLLNEQRAAELAGRKPTPKQGEREIDRFEQYANRTMLAVLCKSTAQHGSAASDASLAEMIHVKHNYADKYREMCIDEPEASLEMRDALIEALTRRFVPRDAPKDSAPAPSAPAPGDTWSRTLAQLAISNSDTGHNAPIGSKHWAPVR